jgi:lipoprotein-releasing system permease protein
MSYEYFIAKRYLRAKRQTGFISLITYISIGGVTIGVAALIIVLSVMNGFESEVRNRIIGADAHIRVETFHNEGVEDWENMRGRIEEVPHVVGVSPYITDKGMIRCGQEIEGVLVRGIDPATIGEVSDLPDNIVYGSLDLEAPADGSKLPGIVLGKYLADRLLAIKGDTVLVFSAAGFTSTLSQPLVKVFRVAGIFETGLFEFDDTIAYISISSAQKLFRTGDKVHGVEIKLDDMWAAQDVKNVLEATLGYPYYLRTWIEMRRNLFSWMKVEKWVWFILLSLIIMVAAFNVISTLIMVVLEKKKEIGILKSMGATAKGISKIFTIQGLIVGVIGAVLGTILGWVICYIQIKYKVFGLPADIYFLDWLPVRMQWFDFVAIDVVAVLLSYLAAVYPARKAAKLDPVEAIRYE